MCREEYVAIHCRATCKNCSAGTSRHTAVVGAESLFGSLLILFSMVALITCTIACFGWRMTRCLGYCLFLFYAAFIAQDFARAQGLLVIPGF